MNESMEPSGSSLDPESVELYAAAIVQNEARAIDQRNQAVQTAADRFDQNFWQRRKLDKAIYMAAGNYDELAKQRRHKMLKVSATLGSSIIGLVGAGYIGEKFLVENWLGNFMEYWQNIRPR